MLTLILLDDSSRSSAVASSSAGLSVHWPLPASVPTVVLRWKPCSLQRRLTFSDERQQLTWRAKKRNVGSSLFTQTAGETATPPMPICSEFDAPLAPPLTT